MAVIILSAVFLIVLMLCMGAGYFIPLEKAAAPLKNFFLTGLTGFTIGIS